MNNKAQFTPGPWDVKHDNQHDETLVQNEHTTVATVWRTEPAYEVNAHLIAAAPAMYEALLQVREMLLILADNAGDVPEWNTGGELYELAHTVRTALAQAEGR